MVLMHRRIQSLFMLTVALNAILANSGVLASDHYGKCTEGSLLDVNNRDNKKPKFPLKEDLRVKSSYIYKAHEILRNELEKLSELKNMDLGTYLSNMTLNNATYFDEFGEEISTYKDVWGFIWKQYNETLCENYATKQFENDKLDLCGVSRYLFLHYEDRLTLTVERMEIALRSRCDSCLPYSRRGSGETSIFCSPALPPPRNNPTNSKTCTMSNKDVVCDKVSLEEIQKFFRWTSLPALNSLKILLQQNIFTKTFIPADVLQNKRTFSISIEYPFSLVADPFGFQMDRNAFRSNRNYTEEIELEGIDCALLDLGFLSGFNKLTKLSFLHIHNIQRCLPSLPPLPRLQKLHMDNCRGLNELSSYPNLTIGLKGVEFFGSSSLEDPYIDETVDRFMDWLLLFSASTLEEMEMSRLMWMTKVPHNISSFKALKKLVLYQSGISTIKSGAFSFSTAVSVLAIEGHVINKIEPGAFQGDFKDAKVYLQNNNMNRFDEAVFGLMLQQIASGGGFVKCAKGNKFDCSKQSICHLAWLRRFEAGSDFHLNCSNGTKFQDLQPAGFNHCYTTTSSVTSAAEFIKPTNYETVYDYKPCKGSNGDIVCDQGSGDTRTLRHKIFKHFDTKSLGIDRKS